MSDVSILLRIYVWERVWMKRLLYNKLLIIIYQCRSNIRSVRFL